jgi:hypothetical protein
MQAYEAMPSAAPDPSMSFFGRSAMQTATFEQFGADFAVLVSALIFLRARGVFDHDHAR